MPREFDLEAFDAEWDKRFNGEEKKEDDNTEKEEEGTLDDSLEEEIEEEVVVEEESVDKEEPVGDEEIHVETPTKTKADYAFAEMRKENNAYKKQLREKEENEKAFLAYVKENGFDSIDSFMKAEQKKRYTREAEEKGVAPEFYAEFMQMKENLEASKRREEEKSKQEKLTRFTSEFDSLATEYTLSDAEREKILSDMSDDGYTVDDLYSVKNPKKFILGYIPDKIAEKTKQAELKSKKAFEEKPFAHQGSVTGKAAMKQLIEKEMEEYRKLNGFN